ncbi:MAG: beta-lactamase/transpeptidase-like protein [Podila humilis]|nr:MAG: beta-lactamase/transpeptidase-like protein [Podila humilis]
MVKSFLILAVALVLQNASAIHAEPDSATCGASAIHEKLKVDLEMARNHTGIPGMSIAIIHRGKLIFAEGFGKRNMKDPFTPETQSMLASVTKAFTATTIGELVAEGKMDWDKTPVNTYLPEFKTMDPILTSQLTIQDLLSHRTNFPDPDATWMWSTETRRDLIKRIRHLPVDPKLRSTVNYNNVMYAVAGEAAARVTGVPFETLVRNKIIRPLGLINTGITMGEMRKSPNHALPYLAASYEDAVAGRFVELPLDGGAEKTAAAGDMYASVLDLAQWGQVVMKGGMQNGKQVLSKEGIEATLTARTIMDPVIRDPDFALSSQYGMGWMLNSYKGYNLYEHSGGHFGYVTHLALFPDAELVVAHLTNSGVTALPRRAALHIADEILALHKTKAWLTETAIAMTKKMYVTNNKRSKGSFPKRVLNKPPAHEMVDYAGEFDHPAFGTATVRLEAGKLHMTVAAFNGVLDHYHFDSFTTVLQHTGLKMGQLVTFSTGLDGKVTGATFALLEDAYFFEKKKRAKAEGVADNQHYSFPQKQVVLSG